MTIETIDIRIPAHQRDWRRATALLFDYIEWIRAASGIDPLDEQPGFATELAGLRDAYRPPDRILFLAFDRGLPVGTVAVVRHPDATAELKRLYVRPIARGSGVATALVDAALEHARSLGAERCWLETLRGVMDPAIRLYHRRGFRETTLHSMTIDVDGVVAMEMPLRSGTRGTNALTETYVDADRSSRHNSDEAPTVPAIPQPWSRDAW